MHLELLNSRQEQAGALYPSALHFQQTSGGLKFKASVLNKSRNFERSSTMAAGSLKSIKKNSASQRGIFAQTNLEFYARSR